jgi:hypothetical protein
MVFKDKFQVRTEVIIDNNMVYHISCVIYLKSDTYVGQKFM